ncbi:MAG TPA: acyl-CoA dehydrogenase, partial [Desulfofustis sp.]|nr:acyl-CoA dehydrogenase [Desulfofustis sp.]
MNFELSEEQKLIQDTAREFAKAELEPVAAELDQGHNQQSFFENLTKLAELGFMGLNIEDSYGG